MYLKKQATVYESLCYIKLCSLEGSTKALVVLPEKYAILRFLIGAKQNDTMDAKSHGKCQLEIVGTIVLKCNFYRLSVQKKSLTV